MLGNTPAICRKCYIHTAIFDRYLDGTLIQALQRRVEETLTAPEHGMIARKSWSVVLPPVILLPVASLRA
jgi:DNA topoisomerase I